MSGLDWLDLLLVLRPGMLDAVCDRFTESFNRQTQAVQQFFYLQYLCVKASLYRLGYFCFLSCVWFVVRMYF